MEQAIQTEEYHYPECPLNLDAEQLALLQAEGELLKAHAERCYRIHGIPIKARILMRLKSRQLKFINWPRYAQWLERNGYLEFITTYVDSRTIAAFSRGLELTMKEKNDAVYKFEQALEDKKVPDYSARLSIKQMLKVPRRPGRPPGAKNKPIKGIYRILKEAKDVRRELTNYIEKTELKLKGK